MRWPLQPTEIKQPVFARITSGTHARCWPLLLLVTVVALVSVCAWAEDSTNRFLFLRLRFQAGTVSLVSASVVPGALKPQQDSTESESLLISLEELENQTRWSVAIADPSIRRYEYEDPQQPGALKTEIVELDDVEVAVRAPLLPGVRHVAVYRSERPIRQPNGEQAMERRLLSRIRLPDPDEATSLSIAHSKVAVQATMQALRSNAPTAKRLNIVFLSEGYTNNELARFPSDAMRILNAFLTTSPLREYSNYFNAFAISVPSNESGSDHYTPITNLVDTYFNSRYDSSGIQRLITINSTGLSRVNALLAQFIPEYDIVALVVNDTQYGGSGGFPLISSINSQSAEIALHELGHSFAGLGDEYSSAGGSPAERPNATANTNLALIKWNAWIPDGTPIPTADISMYYNVIGLFQGAVYSTNYYRPKHNCKMRNLGVSFCEVCSEALVKSIYSQLRPIEGFSPATNQVLELTNGIVRTFSVSNVSPSTVGIQWFVNGSPPPNATSAVFTLSGFDLSSGTNLLSVKVSDSTTFVRNDPANLLTQTVQWRVKPMIASPTISITRGVGQVSLSWPPTAAWFFLESDMALTVVPVWTPLLLISNQTGVTLPSDNPQRMFQLHHP